MLFWSRDAREAREYVQNVLPNLSEAMDDSTTALDDLRFRAQRALRARLADGDVGTVEGVLRQAEANLDACRRVLPVLEEYVRSGRLDHAVFRELKPLLLHEDEDPSSVSFSTAPEAVRWLADRALEFAQYVRDTQIPWLEQAMEQVRDSASEADKAVEEAERARKDALDRLGQIRAVHPQISLVYSEQIAQEMEELYGQMQDAVKRRVYREVQEAADRVKRAAETAVASAEEALEFLRDPETKLQEGQAFLDRLAERYRLAGLELPDAFFASREALQAAGEEVRSREPDWTEAMRLYSEASGLAGEAASLLEEGR